MKIEIGNGTYIEFSVPTDLYFMISNKDIAELQKGLLQKAIDFKNTEVEREIQAQLDAVTEIQSLLDCPKVHKCPFCDVKEVKIYDKSFITGEKDCDFCNGHGKVYARRKL